MYRGILFDFDGTLARTMEDNLEAWRAVTKGYGIDLKADDYLPFEGLPMKEVAAHFFTINGLAPPDVVELAKLKDEWYLKHHRFSFYPGVEELVDSLAHGRVPMGIVTAGLRGRLEKSVPGDFLEKFTTIVTGNMTQRGKPHPDPYLAGAGALGLNPEDCVVVENAPLGIQAAKSARSYCIAVCTTLGRGYLTEADEIVERFEELSGLSVIRGILP
jgi:beta-phosphoglucomutase